MRRLLAPLTRWLDQRIDARIAAAAEAGRLTSVDAFARTLKVEGQNRFFEGLDARINLRIAEALDAAGLIGNSDGLPGWVPRDGTHYGYGPDHQHDPLPAGHIGLAEMAATGISDAAAVHHARDPARHGLSIERVALNAEASTGGMLDDLPPVGESFFQVIAAENGTILLGGGALLPDSHVQYGSLTRMGPAAARAVAFALLRASEVVGRA